MSLWIVCTQSKIICDQEDDSDCQPKSSLNPIARLKSFQRSNSKKQREDRKGVELYSLHNCPFKFKLLPNGDESYQ